MQRPGVYEMSSDSDSNDPGAAVSISGEGLANDPTLVTEHARLAAEREVCERTLQEIDNSLSALISARLPGGDTAALDERLRWLTGLDPEFRTQLHIIMGYIQLQRLEPNASPQVESRLDAMLNAGGRLLEIIHDVNLLSDKGSTFAPARIESGIQQSRAAPGKRRLDVLIVDDIEMNRDIAAALLRAAGHCVCVTDDGASAWLMATKLDLDVILMDVRMPGMDGLEATRRIREMRGPRGDVPIIALTAKVSPEEVAACRAAGMSGHLAKPFRHDTLNEAVERAASLRPGDACVPLAAIVGGTTNGLSALRLRALIAPSVARVAGGAADLPGDAWIDIVSPWSAAQTERSSDQPASEGRLPTSGQLVVKLIRERLGAQANLIDPRQTCAPPTSRDQHEYHWLLFVEPGTIYPNRFAAECELWRWHRGNWRSVAVPGANFSPDDMYRDGWRYASSCDNAAVRVEIVEPNPATSDPKSIWRTAGAGFQKQDQPT